MAKNTYKQDEILEEPFDIRHLLRASSYIKKYQKRMIIAILLSSLGGAFGYIAPMITQHALDVAIPDKNFRLLFSLAIARKGHHPDRPDRPEQYRTFWWGQSAVDAGICGRGVGAFSGRRYSDTSK